MTVKQLTRGVLVGASAPKLQSEEVMLLVPQEDGSKQQYSVQMCEMSANERTAYDAEMLVSVNPSDQPWEELTDEQKDERLNQTQAEIRERLVVATAKDKKGNRIFQYADIKELGKRGASILEPMVNMAQKLNGFSQGDIEELAKNSKGTNDKSSS